jgi:hypothetical protein
MPAHVHVPKLGSSLSTSPTATHSAVEFEFLLGERSGGDWILSRKPYVAVSLEQGIRRSPWLRRLRT